MNRLVFGKAVVVGLMLVLVLSGCSKKKNDDSGGGGEPVINLSGKWTATNTTTYTSNPDIFQLGGVTTAKFTISDKSGNLTITDFVLVGQEIISWDTGSGTFNSQSRALSAHLSGSYKNIYEQTVSVTISFSGTIKEDGISGTGTWEETLNVSGNIYSASGTSELFKG